MAVINGDLFNVAKTPTVGEVRFTSVGSRISGGGSVVTTEPWSDRIRGGKFRTPDLEPGPALVEVFGQGYYEKWNVVIPQDGSVDFSVLIESDLNWTPREISVFEGLVDQARRAASRASEVGSSVSSAVSVVEEARRVAEVAARRAEEAADRAGDGSSVVSPDLSGLVDRESFEALKAELSNLRNRLDVVAPRWNVTEGLPIIDDDSKLDLTPKQWAALKYLESVGAPSARFEFVNRALGVREIAEFVGAGGIESGSVLSEGLVQLQRIRELAPTEGLDEWKEVVSSWKQEVGL